MIIFESDSKGNHFSIKDVELYLIKVDGDESLKLASNFSFDIEIFEF